MAMRSESLEPSPWEDAQRNDADPKVPARQTRRMLTMQLFIVLLIQTTEPVSATVVYPFINQLVRETGITKGDARRTGYFAGMIESLFFVSEALTVVYWSRASDRYGRKPVLLLGLAGLVFAMLSFGVSKSFWAVMFSRCAQGTFNGNLVVTRTMMAEMLEPAEIPDAFGLLPLVWATGSTLGPILGGVLARPALRWPDTIGKVAMFTRFPYFLPCAVAAGISALMLLWGLISLHETSPVILEKREKRKAMSCSPELMTERLLDGSESTQYGTQCSTQPVKRSTVDANCDQESLRRLVGLRQVYVPMLNHAFLTLGESCYQALLPLMYSTPISLGGLGLTPFEIGIILGTWGLVNGIIQVFFFGPILRIVGIRRLYIVSFGSMFITVAAYPCMSYFAQRAGQVDEIVWAIMLVQLTTCTLVYMAFGCCSIYVIDAAPDPSLLGVTNGLAQMLASSTRVFGPSMASSLFSISLERQLLGGQMVYIVLWVIVAVGFRVSFLLPKRLHSQ